MPTLQRKRMRVDEHKRYLFTMTGREWNIVLDWIRQKTAEGYDGVTATDFFREAIQLQAKRLKA